MTDMILSFAELSLRPGGVIAWIVVGLIAGWLAGIVMRGGGYGLIGDLVLGLIGALIGGFLTSFLIQGETGFLGSIFVSFLGAVVLVAISRAFTGRRTTRPGSM
jgi:uncharacterized membrane protein YeaQ/YmgE (transglycosylase-associated protein family)